MDQFFKVTSVAEVLRLAAQVSPLPAEEVPLLASAGRVLAGDLAAPADLPGFFRSTVDGYAVAARDTYGSGEGSPAYLALAGQVAMGEPPAFALAPGQCARIGTGGMLPSGADAVVMLEHSRLLDSATVEVAKALAPGANRLGPSDDAARGQVLLPAGHRLRPQDVGLLAALGLERVAVARRPRVGIVSTGDEVVPVTAEPGPGQVRDVNSHSLFAAVAAAGGEPRLLGLWPDDPARLKAAAERSLGDCDLTLVSGGSSVGSRDYTAGVFLSLPGARLLVHGVAVSPGKPFLWVQAGGHHFLGLPGQVASCLVAFHLLAEPLLERLQGRPAEPFARFPRLAATLSRPLPSAPGREEYVRVRVRAEGGDHLAEPVFGKSGLLTTLIKGHGLVRVPATREGFYAGDRVEVLLFPG